MTEVQELKRALLKEDFDKAEKLLRQAVQSGAISPMTASQISTYIAMARWETGPDNDAAAKLKTIIATRL